MRRGKRIFWSVGLGVVPLALYYIAQVFGADAAYFAGLGIFLAVATYTFPAWDE